MLDVLLMIVSVVIILLSLLQSGKTDGMSGAFTGGDSLNLFSNTKERGVDKVLSRATFILGIIFFVLVIVIKLNG